MNDSVAVGKDVAAVVSRFFRKTTENTIHSFRVSENKKAGLISQTGLFNLIPAMTYAPTQLPVQYHRPGEA